MIHPEDQDTIAAMVGDVRLSSPFKDEYEKRLRMLHLSGRQGPLGAEPLMHLLREFEVEPKPKQRPSIPSSWADVPKDQIVEYQGRRGIFRGACGEGTVGVLLEGERAVREVPEREIQFMIPRVEGMNESEFEREPLNELQKAAQAEVPNAMTESLQELIAKWGEIEAGTKFLVQPEDRRRKPIECEYIDVADDGENLLFYMDGKQIKVDPIDVVPQEAAV